MKLKLVAGLVVLVVTTATLSLPSTAHAAPKKPKGAPAATASLGSSSAIAKWLLEKAGGVLAAEGFGFLFSSIGLSSLFPSQESKDIAALKNQLDQIGRQLTALQASVDNLSRDITENNLNQQLRELRTKTIQMRDLYDLSFQPLLDAAERYQRAQESDPDDIDDAKDALIARRNEFYIKYDGYPYSSIANEIHAYLVPNGSQSVIAAKGRVLLRASGGRFLTADDSKILRDLYNALATQAALAAWLRMERYLPTIRPFPPSGTSPGSMQQFNTARTQFVENTRDEFVNLPPVIPDGVVVDVGPGAPNTTNNAMMWTPGSESNALRFIPGESGPGTVPYALTELNTSSASTFTDWQVPSQRELAFLLAGNVPVGDVPAAKTPNDFLAGLNPNHDSWDAINGKDKWPFIWSDDDTNWKTSCYPTSGYVYTATTKLPLGVTTTTPTPQWSHRPPLVAALGGKYQSPSTACNNYVRDMLAGNTGNGAVLATRSTGRLRIDYMAQGDGPNIHDRAKLRNADLTGFMLPGVDLSDVDLTNAKLTDANLSDADLSHANLTGIVSGGIIGEPNHKPDLPRGWVLANGYLVGPGADLRGANLQNADLREADLRGVLTGGTQCADCQLPPGWVLGGGFLIGPGSPLVDADLRDVNLDGVDLSGADLTDADLRGASLRGAKFRGTDLTRANLREADLTGADFFGAILTETNLREAVLTDVRSGGIVLRGFPPTLWTGWTLAAGYLIGPEADLSDMDGANADFTGADLYGADFEGANLRNAIFKNANLRSTVFTGANISGADFTTDNDNKLAGMVSGDLRGTPKALPVSGRFRIVENYFVGPSANLEGAKFSPNAQLGPSLSATNFTGATLKGVNLAGAALNNTIFEDAILTGVNITGAAMPNAKLNGVSSGGVIGAPIGFPSTWRLINGWFVGIGAQLEGAQLNSQNFTGMDLRGADLHNAGLNLANFTNTNLEGARTVGAWMGSITWSNTRCPDGIVRSSVCSAAYGTQKPVIDIGPANGGIAVTVTPALPAQWRLTIEQRTDSGGFIPLTTVATAGANNLVIVKLTNNSFRVRILPQNGYASVTSEVWNL